MSARRRIAPGRLHDRVGPNLQVLFVGINPGLRSAALDHHFAGPSNRFWKLLSESGLVPRRVTFEDDDRLPGWGYGITNLAARPTAGIGDLDARELLAGRDALVRKVRRLRPRIVALVGTTVYRTLFGVKGPVRPGPAPERLGGALVFVLPNPSGRNAHHSYAEMVEAYRALARTVENR
jgi:TDG/mug DNA glycosylase family protein